MTRKLTHETTLQIGETSVLLNVEFEFSPGYPATGPSYSCGGEPACPAEVYIHSLAWGREKAAPAVWHTIDGALFDLISADEELYGELCQAAADDDAEARESAAERRYEQRREDRA